MGKSIVCGTTLVAMDLGPNCLGLTSMSNKPRADWAIENQIDLSLVVDPPSEKFSGILADIISIPWHPFGLSTSSMPDDSGNLGGTLQ